MADIIIWGIIILISISSLISLFVALFSLKETDESRKKLFILSITQITIIIIMLTGFLFTEEVNKASTEVNSVDIKKDSTENSGDSSDNKTFNIKKQ